MTRQYRFEQLQLLFIRSISAHLVELFFSTVLILADKKRVLWTMKTARQKENSDISLVEYFRELPSQLLTWEYGIKFFYT